MDLSRVIIGPVVTEKAERQKVAETGHVYALKVAPKSTKVDIRNAVERLYGVQVSKVRIVKIQPKTRVFSAHASMEKRHAGKKALVTLKKGSKALDLASIDSTRSA
jgi:large subunit ribosomal protein L23